MYTEPFEPHRLPSHCLCPCCGSRCARPEWGSHNVLCRILLPLRRITCFLNIRVHSSVSLLRSKLPNAAYNIKHETSQQRFNAICDNTTYSFTTPHTNCNHIHFYCCCRVFRLSHNAVRKKTKRIAPETCYTQKGLVLEPSFLCAIN
jgi:hypothetical protein